jgi:histidinol-phosphate/aromatic aminotransferase/cobyric acid decarboxylase-like protein
MMSVDVSGRQAGVSVYLGGYLAAFVNVDAYPLLADMVGAEPVPVRLLADGRQDLEAIDRRTRVVVVCNPHNPTGRLVTADELAAFLGRVPDHVTVVLDEAAVEASLTAAGVRARYYPGEGVRLTVGVRSANDAALAALA